MAATLDVIMTRLQGEEQFRGQCHALLHHSLQNPGFYEEFMPLMEYCIARGYAIQMEAGSGFHLYRVGVKGSSFMSDGGFRGELKRVAFDKCYRIATTVLVVANSLAILWLTYLSIKS